jgi:AmiR/NasT family two-component response regulator
MQSDISTALSEVSEARAEIEQAKGVLMAAYGFNADRAFGLLVHHSQETNIKVRDLAHRFITAIAGSRSAETRRQVDQALLNISGNGRQ